LKQEYIFLSIFLSLFAILLAFTVEPKLGTFYTTTAFVVGGFTSILAGYIGMRIAVYTNVRTAKESATDISNGFIVAYRGGQVLGFTLVGLALLVLQILIVVFQALYMRHDPNN
jgi:Na+/H+-translocating membrane pyrophosphatase